MKHVGVIIGLMLILAAVMNIALVLVAAAALYGLWRLTMAVTLRAVTASRTRRQIEAHRRAEMLARAELQHRWYLDGDPRGTYGRYPPVRIRR